jgi:hypothetical protein
MRILFAIIGRACEILWPAPDLRYRIDDEADALADLEAEHESTPHLRFGPAFEGEAGNSPGVVSAHPPVLPRPTAVTPTPGQPELDLYVQALSIVGLLDYHQLLDVSAHQCHCLHKAHSLHGHHKHISDLIINVLDADHRVTQQFQQ